MARSSLTLPVKALPASGSIVSIVSTLCPLSDAMNFTVSPGLIFTNAGSKTMTPSAPLLSIFTSTSAAPAAPANPMAAHPDPLSTASRDGAAPLRLQGLDGFGMAVPLHHGCPSTIEIAPAAPHGLAAGADAAHLAHDLRTRTLDPLGDQAAQAEEPQQFRATAGAGPRKPGQLFRRERDTSRASA